MGWLTAIGNVAGILRELGQLFYKAWTLWKKARTEGWIEEGRQVAREIQNAQTDEDRRRLVRELAEHASRRP